jgi:hypothetical protein
MNPSAVVCKTITLAGQAIVLTAKSVHQYICEWHLHSFAKALFLGAPRKAVKVIAESMGLAEKVDADEIINSIDQSVVQSIPPLKVFTSESDVALTDIVINNISGSKKFGIGLQITNNNHLGPVTIDGVAFLITLTPEAKQDSQSSTHDKNNV